MDGWMDGGKCKYAKVVVGQIMQRHPEGPTGWWDQRFCFHLSQMAPEQRWTPPFAVAAAAAAPPLMLLALRSRLWRRRWWLHCSAEASSSGQRRVAARLSCLIGVSQSERRWLNLHKLTMFRNCSHWCSEFFVAVGRGPAQSSHAPCSMLRAPCPMFQWPLSLARECVCVLCGPVCAFYWFDAPMHLLSLRRPQLLPVNPLAMRRHLPRPCSPHFTRQWLPRPDAQCARQWGGYIRIRVSHISAKLIDCGSLGLHLFRGWPIAVRWLRWPKLWLKIRWGCSEILALFCMSLENIWTRCSNSLKWT